MDDVTILATGLGFPEGPVVCADGSVVLTEIRTGRCTRVTQNGEVSVFSNCGGGPNGLAIGPDGYFYRVYSVPMKQGVILWLLMTNTYATQREGH